MSNKPNETNRSRRSQSEWFVAKRASLITLAPVAYLIRWVEQMKTGFIEKLWPQVRLATLVAVLVLMCSGCQTFMTEDEYQAEVARESKEPMYYFFGPVPQGSLATWR
jgi:hypothetical protein